MNNLDIKLIIAWLLGITFITYLFIVASCNSNNIDFDDFGDDWQIDEDWHYVLQGNKDWHFTNSLASFMQNVPSELQDEKSWHKYSGKEILNNMNFNYGDYNSCEAVSFQTGLVASDTINEALDNIVNEEDQSQVNVIAEKKVEKKIEKKIEKKVEKKVEKKKIIVNRENNEANSESIINTNETVEEKEVVEEVIDIDKKNTIAEVIEEDIQIKEPIKNKVKVEKVKIEKPKMKDYKNSSDYQKALRKYYKSIEE